MNGPKNRQEFLMQQREATAHARDMQRRATLPPPRPPPPRPPPVSRSRWTPPKTSSVPVRADRSHHTCPPCETQRPPKRFAETHHKNYQNQVNNGTKWAPPSPNPLRNEEKKHQKQEKNPISPDIFSLFSQFSGKKKEEQDHSDSSATQNEGGMDGILILLLSFLLKKESADQGLLMALMYIMM